MASALSLCLLCVLGLGAAVNTHADGGAAESLTQDAPLLPHFTGCLSREQETFRCWWTSGSFTNLSEPGALSVFFITKKATNLHSNWRECPEYTANVENECYFNQTYTEIWTSYCVQLRATAHNLTYDEYCFTVENIVHPDPPVALNWTLLNLSRSGLNFDILVRWAPPPSADVEVGWMTLKYEVNYRARNSSHWNKLDLESGTQQSIYGLRTDVEYEVRVRCKMSAFKNFGDFSDSVFVKVASVTSKEFSFPATLLLVLGVLGLLVLAVLIIFTQQQRLMVILLPPVPAPKIKGIDPELLKKGKLEQLNSLLSSQHMYQPDVYQESPWVEFIQLDLDEMDEKNQNSDTQRLLGTGTKCVGVGVGIAGDEDSGRASCYDPDLQDHEGVLTATPLPRHTENEERRHALVAGGDDDEAPTQSWINMDFYAQVSDVTPAGGVLLSPGQQGSVKEPETMMMMMMKKKKEEEEAERRQQEEEDDKKTATPATTQVQYLVSDPNDGGYSSENVARFLSPEPPAETPPPPGLAYAPASTLPPVSDYTVVQELDGQRSLLVDPTTPRLPPEHAKRPPHNPPPPAVPTGYLTPELLHDLSH